MSTILSMKISDKYQHSEEELHQSMYLRQENLVKELILSQLVQAEPRDPLLRFMEMLRVKVRRKQHQEHQHQKK